jgi:L-glyceraldehyde 3-phosphate reductase
VSSYSGHQFTAAADIVKEHDWAPITIHQPYYNMLSSGIETDLLPHTVQRGAGVIAFCPLAGGLLTGRYLNGLPADSRQGKRGEAGRQWWQEEQDKGVWDRLGQLNSIAAQRGQTMAQMALAWVVRKPSVTSALIGASGVSQIEQNLNALGNLEFSDAELARIAAITAQWT